MTASVPEFSIVIPLYNEEAVVGRSVEELLEALEGAFAGRYELILVVNGSTDRTGAICEGLAWEFSQLKMVRAPVNLGYGGGILTGLAHARGAYCGFTCGDRQVAPDALVQVMREMATGHYDLVKTYRVVRGDGLGRRIQSMAYNWLFQRLFRISCRDINAMPKLMRRQVYEQLALVSTDWFIDAEMMIKAERIGLRVKEVPVIYLRRRGGASAVRLSTVFEFLQNAQRFLAARGATQKARSTRAVPETEAVGEPVDERV